MKTVFVIVCVAALLAGAYFFKYFFISGTYESIEYGVRFSYPSSLIARELPEKEMLVIQKPIENLASSFVFFKKYANSTGRSELTFRIPVEFGVEMLSEDHIAKSGINGISFNWQGPKGLEKAFAFEAGDRDYVLSTYGMPDTDIENVYNTVLNSLFVTYK